MGYYGGRVELVADVVRMAIGHDENHIYCTICNGKGFEPWAIVHDGCPLGRLVDYVGLDEIREAIYLLENPPEPEIDEVGNNE